MRTALSHKSGVRSICPLPQTDLTYSHGTWSIGVQALMNPNEHKIKMVSLFMVSDLRAILLALVLPKMPKVSNGYNRVDVSDVFESKWFLGKYSINRGYFL